MSWNIKTKVLGLGLVELGPKAGGWGRI